MLSIADTITQYENTRLQLLMKIQIVTDSMRDVKKQMSGRYQNDSTFVKLSYRRNTLKDMLNDVEYALKQLREYQAAILFRSDFERMDINETLC